MVKVSVVVCAFNEELRIKDCLNSIKPQTIDNFEYEILIIDNESSDDTENICRKFVEKNKINMNINYMRIEHVSLSKSRNIGIKNTTGSKIIFIDADALADKNWLSELLTGFENPEVDIVSGKIKNLNIESNFSQFIYKAHFESLVTEDKTQVLNHGDSNLIGANMGFRRIVFEKLGGFFNNIKGRGDETAVATMYFNLCPSRREKYVSSAIVYNEHADSLFVWLKQQYSEGKSYARIISLKNKSSLSDSLKFIIRLGNISLLFFLLLSPIIGLSFVFLFSIFPLIRYGYRYKFILKSFLGTMKSLGIIKAVLSVPTIILGTLALDSGCLIETVFSKNIK